MILVQIWEGSRRLGSLILASCHLWSHDQEGNVQCYLYQEWKKKIDKSIHLVKGIPAWKITAQSNVQNSPTVSPLLLSSSSMDRSPNCMIPFVLI